MFTKYSVFRLLVALFIILMISSTASASPLKAPNGTGFTYQGKLMDGGVLANGTYDLQFRLFDALISGNQVGSTITQLGVTVTNGLFTVQLDFGNVFNGTALYLEIGVRLGGSSGSYTTLTPLQPLSPTPYALYTTQSGNTGMLNNQPASYYLNASNINTGTLGTNYFSAYADLVAEGYLGNAANDLALNNGTLQTTLNADLLDGLHAASFALASHTHWGETWTGSGTGLTLSGGATGLSGSGSSYGVSGSSTNGFGVSGSSTNGLGVSGSGGIYGVYGSSTSGTGVYGSGGAYGVYGSGPTGVFGSGSANGVYGSGPTGVYGSGSTNGVYGSGPTGVYGSGSTNGVSGFSTNGEGVSGTSTNGYGVSGSSTNTTGVYGSGYSSGVRGTSTNSNGDGVDGLGYYGVSGYSTTSGGVGVYGYAHQGSGDYAGYFSGNVRIVGNQTVTGTKSAVVKTQDYGTRTLYAVESPENWFQDFGTGQLTNGKAVITIDPVFAETVNLADDYHVFFTPMGDCALYVTDKTPTSFTVKALGGQTCSIAFDYNIVAKRLGYETVRLAVADPSPAVGTPNGGTP